MKILGTVDNSKLYTMSPLCIDLMIVDLEKHLEDDLSSLTLLDHYYNFHDLNHNENQILNQHGN